jgi:hypothetical protein
MFVQIVPALVDDEEPDRHQRAEREENKDENAREHAVDGLQHRRGPTFKGNTE